MWGRIFPHAALLILANIILKASCKGNGSLTFVIDNTYSMHDDIAQVKSSVDRISNTVFNEKSSQIENMVLVTFNDPDAEVRAVTKDRNAFKRILDKVTVSYGGDCWEPSMKGLLLALENSNHDSYIYVFTDADAKDYRKSHFVKEMCQKKQSRIVFVLTGQCGDTYEAEAFDVYFEIAHACTGQAFYVPKNEVEDVLSTIEESIKGNQTVITSKILLAGARTDIPFIIDDHTDFAIVSVSGTNVDLNITGPSHDVQYIMWNRNAKVVKLSNVKPGRYEATVMGQSKTSVVIVGRTDFFFSHGFSVVKPKSLGDTSLQPIAESKVHLSISVTDEHRSVQILSAQILDMNEKPINGPMNLTETSENFYVTNLFVAPSQRFKVAVNGITKATGKSVRRISKIPITPQEYAPVIVTNSSTVEGIEGDLALRIPCDAVGVPKPVITWKLKGVTITAKAKYTLEDGALIIKKPTDKDTSSYTCEAKNRKGSVRVMFPVKVNKYPESSGTLHYVYLKQDENKKLECEAYKSKSQSVKWFITRTITHLTTTSSRPDYESTTTWSKDDSTATRIIDAGNKEYIQIASASPYDHDGNYTCRVSDKHGNTQTHTYVVDVGNAPGFVYDDESNITNWKGDITDITQKCDLRNTKPKPDIEWRFNGKVITDLSLAGVGHYTCNVSNVHGSVLKQFVVESSACLIARNLKDAPYRPLLLNAEGFWHTLETTKHYTIVEQEEKIILSCPSQKETSNAFKSFPKKSTLEAICYKEDEVLVDDKIYKLSDLQCTHSVEPSVVNKKAKCSTETSELLSVGYNVPAFLEAYEVCFDHKINMPLYTRILMSDTNNNGANGNYNWYTYPGIGTEKTERGFTCKDASSSCCYSKSQLVNAIDFNDGPAKKSTFIDPLNVIPVWVPCDTSKSSWKDINDMVRSQLPIYIDIVVWSGTHTLQEKNGAIIPRYLWKVVRLIDDEVIAIVHVNDPNPTKSDIKCKTPDVCDSQTYKYWITKDDSTYCCSLPDFLKSFDIHGTDIGETMEAVLSKIVKT